MAPYKRILSKFGWMCLALIVFGTLSQAQVVISPQSIVVNPKPSFTVSVFVDKDTSGDQTPSYNVGDNIRVGVEVSEDAYVYLYNVRSNGEINQIIPNRYDDAGRNNFVRAGQTKYFPAQNASYTFGIEGPQGLDKVIAVASKEQLDTAQLASFGNDPNFASSNQGEESFAQTLSIVVKPKAQNSWVTDTALFYVGAPPATPRYGTLTIDSDPRGANVYVDDQFVGTTPVRFGTRSGSHSIRLELSGRAPYSTTVDLSGGQTLPLNITLGSSTPQPQNIQSTVRFESNPRGAEVLIGGQSYGQTPTAEIRLAAGSYRATFRRNGYTDAVVNFDLRSGGSQTVSASLAEVARPPQTNMISDALGIRLYPGASLTKLEQKSKEVKAEFDSGDDFQRVFADFDAQLEGSGWRRIDLEQKSAATKLEARYVKRGGGGALELKLDRKGNSGKYVLEIDFNLK